MFVEYFRVTVNNCDVWNKLSHNWDHFSWLTGETPDTLNILIDRLKARINLCRKRGRLSPISTRNQVCVLCNVLIIHRIPKVTSFHYSYSHLYFLLLHFLDFIDLHMAQEIPYYAAFSKSIQSVC